MQVEATQRPIMDSSEVCSEEALPDTSALLGTNLIAHSRQLDPDNTHHHGWFHVSRLPPYASPQTGSIHSMRMLVYLKGPTRSLSLLKSKIIAS